MGAVMAEFKAGTTGLSAPPAQFGTWLKAEATRDLSADAIKLGPEPKQFSTKPEPEATRVVEVSSKEWQQKQREELEAKNEKANELKEQLAKQEARLEEMLNRLTGLTKRGEWLKQKIEDKKTEMKALSEYIWDKRALAGDSNSILREELRDKEWEIRSISQQGGPKAEAKIAKVLEAKKRIEETIQRRERESERHSGDIERAAARKADAEREIRALEQELYGVEMEIAQVAETARVMDGDKKMIEGRVADAEKEIAELEAYFGWVETRHMPRLRGRKPIDADSIINDAEARSAGRIARMAEIEEEIREMDKEREERG